MLALEDGRIKGPSGGRTEPCRCEPDALASRYRRLTLTVALVSATSALRLSAACSSPARVICVIWLMCWTLPASMLAASPRSRRTSSSARASASMAVLTLTVTCQCSGASGGVGSGPAPCPDGPGDVSLPPDLVQAHEPGGSPHAGQIGCPVHSRAGLVQAGQVALRMRILADPTLTSPGLRAS